jgi:hypothetical protein
MRRSMAPYSSRVIRVDLACRQHVRLRANLGNASCPVLPIEGIGLNDQELKQKPGSMRYGAFCPTSQGGIPVVKTAC